MKLTLTNKGPVDVPVFSTGAGGWVEKVSTGCASMLDKPGSDVWIIGDKPDILDALREAAGTLALALTKMVTFWKERQRDLTSSDDDVLMVDISNDGDLPIRVILGDPKNEVHVEPGMLHEAQANNYIEIRELGG